MRNIVSFALGIALIVAGLMLLMRTFGLFTIPTMLTQLWPLALLLSGVALLMDKRVLGIILVAIAVVLFSFNVIGALEPRTNAVGTQEYSVPLEAESVNLDIQLGAGQVRMIAGSDDYAVHSLGGRAQVTPENDTATVSSGAQRGWVLSLSPVATYDVHLQHGAGRAVLNFTELDVDNLRLSVGAGTAHVIFGTEPTSGTIDVGVGSVRLHFPEGVGATIRAPGGLTSVSIDGAQKENRRYIIEGEPMHDITVNVGVGTIRGGIING